MLLKTSRAPKWALLILPVVAFLVIATKANQNPPINYSQTSTDATDPELRTRFVRAPWSEVVGAAQNVLNAQKTYGRAWKTGQNSIKGAVPGQTLSEELHAQIPVFVFTDDLTVTLSEQENGTIRVDCESKARIGKGDFGENDRHVRQFLRAFDAELGGKIV